MKIGVCDDNMEFCISVSKKCKDIADLLNVECDIVQFADGTEIVGNREKPDLLILDVEMPGVDGMEVKKWLDSINSRTLIIFVSSYKDKVYEAFGINVFSYILKQDMDSKFDKILTEAIKKINKFVILDNGTDSRSIMFIKAERYYSCLYLENKEKVLIRISIERLAKKLHMAGFAKVHRSYIVNMKYISDFNGDTILIGDIKIPVSCRLRNQAKERYRRYIRNSRLEEYLL